MALVQEDPYQHAVKMEADRRPVPDYVGVLIFEYATDYIRLWDNVVIHGNDPVLYDTDTLSWHSFEGLVSTAEIPLQPAPAILAQESPPLFLTSKRKAFLVDLRRDSALRQPGAFIRHNMIQEFLINDLHFPRLPDDYQGSMQEWGLSTGVFVFPIDTVLIEIANGFDNGTTLADRDAPEDHVPFVGPNQGYDQLGDGTPIVPGGIPEADRWVWYTPEELWVTP
jgi:hypothetical protein